MSPAPPYRALIALAAALSLAACDENAEADNPPITVDPDATVSTPTDASPDARAAADQGPPPADQGPPLADAAPPPRDEGVAPPPGEQLPGRVCDCDTDCAAVDGQDGICVMGLCMVAPSADCGGGEVNGCPEGFQCWSMQDGAGPFCWPDCAHIGADNCAGACDGDDSCAPAEGNACDATCSAFCGGAVTTGDIGGACADDSDCGGATCYVGEGWIDGYCLAFGCAPAGEACGEGGVCISGVADQPVCLGGCAGPDDCRTGYRCAGAEDGNVCFAGCAANDDCPAGFVCNADEVCVVDLTCSAGRPTSGECPRGQICTDGVCEPFVCGADGPLEPNEEQAAALEVDGPVEGLQICAGDNDWYRFTPSDADTIYTVGHHSEYGSGNLDAELVDADGGRVDLSWLLPEGYHDENPRGPMDLEAMSLLGHPDAAEFGLHVFGSSGATNNYDLHFQHIPYSTARIARRPATAPRTAWASPRGAGSTPRPTSSSPPATRPIRTSATASSSPAGSPATMRRPTCPARPAGRAASW